MAEDGTDFVNAPVPGGELPTSRSMIFVSPDGERSMNTYLGISSELGPDDVPDDVARGAEILFLEGYLYDKPKGKEAFERAAKLCRESGGKAGIVNVLDGTFSTILLRSRMRAYNPWGDVVSRLPCVEAALLETRM